MRSEDPQNVSYVHIFRELLADMFGFRTVEQSQENSTTRYHDFGGYSPRFRLWHRSAPVRLATARGGMLKPLPRYRGHLRSRRTVRHDHRSHQQPHIQVRTPKCNIYTKSLIASHHDQLEYLPLG